MLRQVVQHVCVFVGGNGVQVVGDRNVAPCNVLRTGDEARLREAEEVDERLQVLVAILRRDVPCIGMHAVGVVWCHALHACAIQPHPAIHIHPSSHPFVIPSLDKTPHRIPEPPYSANTSSFVNLRRPRNTVLSAIPCK